MKIPHYQLSLYRNSRREFDDEWAKKRDKGKRLWGDVLRNALRLAEAVDRAEVKAKES